MHICSTFLYLFLVLMVYVVIYLFPDKIIINTFVSHIMDIVVIYLSSIAGGLNVEGESDSWDFGVGVSQGSLSIPYFLSAQSFMNRCNLTFHGIGSMT